MIQNIRDSIAQLSILLKTIDMHIKAFFISILIGALAVLWLNSTEKDKTIERLMSDGTQDLKTYIHAISVKDKTIDSLKNKIISQSDSFRYEMKIKAIESKNRKQ